MPEYLIRFRGPSTDDAQRARLTEAGAPIAGQSPDWQNRPHGLRYHRVLVVAEDEDAAMSIVKGVLGSGDPGNYWDKFEIKLYENETAEEIREADLRATSLETTQE